MCMVVKHSLAPLHRPRHDEAHTRQHTIACDARTHPTHPHSHSTHHHIREGQAHERLSIQQHVQHLRMLLLLSLLLAPRRPLLLLLRLCVVSGCCREGELHGRHWHDVCLKVTAVLQEAGVLLRATTGQV